jgi:acyl-CoA thioesterase I
MIREIIEAFIKWWNEQQADLNPVPEPVRVRNEENDRNRPPEMRNRYNKLPLLLIFGLILGTSEVSSAQSSKTILFLGDSLTAGYGIDEVQAYPALIQTMLDAQGKGYKVVNAGLSGETSAGGLRRINWLLRSEVDVLVLALGANDGLRGIDLAVTRQNLQSIIDRVREKNPQVKVIIAGMQVPPNLGTAYTTDFRNIFPVLARQNNAVLIPFLLEDVAGIARLNLPDGIHPTPDGHKIMAQTVWQYLAPVL